jgi:hypothetical protein
MGPAHARTTAEGWIEIGCANPRPCCLPGDDAELLRQAANETAVEWTDQEAARLLPDAATVAEIGA